ncbi:MAG: hypothetical protein K0Q95_3248 [Bacteroidota bacterium]|jgi:hypothetical protein|nr:hypothetical protein [Bacteroidota bacterium]
MREYKISKPWAIFIYITTPLLIALFCWMLIMPFIPAMRGDVNSNAYWILVPISLGMIALMVMGLLDTIKGKFVIDKDQIYSEGVFSKRELMLHEIKGFRVTDKYIFIESNNKEKKKIKVSIYFGNKDEIIEWLAEHYPNLDLVQANREHEEILKSKEFGSSAEERDLRLIKAHKTAKILNWTGGIIAVWTIFLAKPYELSIIASLVFPIVCLIIIKYYNGLIRVDERKGTAYPTILFAMMSGTGICVRALLDYNIFDYSNVWMPSIIITVLYMAVLLLGNKEFKFNKAKDYMSIIAISFFMFAYGYGSVISINCFYDKSQPEIFNPTVLSKRISSGKHTSYYLEVTPWGPQKEIDEVSVSRDLYSRLEPNDQLNIYFTKGKFDIPWFEVTE